MQTTLRTLLALACLAAVGLSLGSGCTIIRYVTDPNNDDGEGDPPPPKIVDMLIMVELDRSTAQLAEDYQQALVALEGGLATSGVTVRRKAVAPMYRRTGSSVPLIFGEGDDGEFVDLIEAITFYTLNDNGRYLPDRVDAEGENLATVGLNLDSASIYRPQYAATDASPYFTVAGDGFIVVQLTAKARSCGYHDAGCKIDGKPAAEYFTAESSGVDWLALPDGNSLPKEKIFFVNIATLEGGNDEDVEKRCTGKVGLNELIIDSIEASAFVYYEDFSEEINDEGGWSEYMETCDALSLAGDVKLAGVGKQIASEIRK